MNMTINTPDNIEDIFRRILNKCLKLIDLQYWDGIEKDNLLSWAKQFDTDEEKFLGAAILNNLIYRSKAAVESFGSNIFHIILPSVLENNDIYNINDLGDWCAQLKNKSCMQFPFRFSTIEGVDRLPGKSGSVIYRTLQRKYFDRNLGTTATFIEGLNKSIKAVVFFDDILGTSDQFSTFVDKYLKQRPDIKFIYIPLVAHQDGLDAMSSAFPNIAIHPVEVLTQENSFFSSENLLFKGRLTSEEVTMLYDRFCVKKNLKIKMNNGHGNMALTYCFSDSTPNNNIPLLWYNSDDWTGLFTR